MSIEEMLLNVMPVKWLDCSRARMFDFAYDNNKAFTVMGRYYLMGYNEGSKQIHVKQVSEKIIYDNRGIM